MKIQSLRGKILFLIFIIFILLFFEHKFFLEKEYLAFKKGRGTQLDMVIYNTISILNFAHSEAKKNSLSDQQKWDYIISTLKKLRKNNKGQIILADQSGKIVYHPSPSLIGSAVSNLKDSKGTSYLTKMLTVKEGEIQDLIKHDKDKKSEYLSKTHFVKNLDVTIIGLLDISSMKIKYNNTKLTAYISLTVIIILSFFITLFFIKLIMSRIIFITEFMKDMAEGDSNLSTRLEDNKNDECSNLILYFNEFLDKIEFIIRSISNSSEQVLTSSREVSSGNNQLSSTTQEMASSLEETAASVEHMNTSIQNAANLASEVASVMKKTTHDAERGSNILSKMMEAMKFVKESGDRIEEIVNVVNELAFQTNLLALNAAVEAARAGEEGKGFAVVASEVRSLAARSADAAKEIKELVENNEENITNANNLSGKTTEALLKVVERIQNASYAIQDVERRAREQSSGIKQINSAIVQMDEVTQRNASLVEELASSAEDMAHIARNLSHDVEQFKLSSTKLSHKSNSKSSSKIKNKSPENPTEKSAANKKVSFASELKDEELYVDFGDNSDSPLPLKTHDSTQMPDSTIPPQATTSEAEAAFMDDDQFEEF